MNPDATRAGEVEVPLPERTDARLVFIGRIRTPFKTRSECPHHGRPDGPVCRIEVDAPWRDGFRGLGSGDRVEVLYWLHQARRDLVLQSPRSDGRARGVFSLRSPLRPNPIGTSVVDVIGIENGTILVRGLDCLDGTPLLDIKPVRCAFAQDDAPVPADDAG